MRIHLIRHGQIHSNVTGALDTAVPGPPLTPVGEQQAEALVEQFNGIPLDSIWASNIIRTQETAAPLAAAKGLNVTVLDGLREISAGDLEMSVEHADRLNYLNVVTQWILGDLSVKLAQGTTGYEVLERFEDALAQVEKAGGQDAAVVAHGAIISFWTGLRCKNLTKELFENFPVVNTGIATVTRENDSWKALSWMGVQL